MTKNYYTKKRWWKVTEYSNKIHFVEMPTRWLPTDLIERLTHFIEGSISQIQELDLGEKRRVIGLYTSRSKVR